MRLFDTLAVQVGTRQDVRLLVGLAASLLGILMMIAAGFVAVSGGLLVDDAVTYAANRETCRASAAAVGFKTQASPDGEAASAPLALFAPKKQDVLAEPAAWLGRASATAVACAGWTMTRFCMGQGCAPGDVVLVLSPPAGPGDPP